MAVAAPVHSIPDLIQLADKAGVYISDICAQNQQNAIFVRIQNLYRNQNSGIFEAILNTGGGIMTTRTKDKSGDPKCPINDDLPGIFFSATLRSWNNQWQLPDISPFGDTRLLVPAQHLVNNQCNLYFADFYCMTGRNNHYVVLVVAIRGRHADAFCQAHLPPLNLQNNSFMKIDAAGNVHVIHAPTLWVEVFYTSDINIRPYHEGGSIEYEKFGRGGALGNLVKKRLCTHCNL